MARIKNNSFIIMLNEKYSFTQRRKIRKDAKKSAVYLCVFVSLPARLCRSDGHEILSRSFEKTNTCIDYLFHRFRQLLFNPGMCPTKHMVSIHHK